MKTALKLSVLLIAVSLLLVGCATSRGGRMAREYRLVLGNADPSGVAAFEEKLNSAGKDGFTIHSTTLLPREEGTRQQAIVILERPTR